MVTYEEVEATILQHINRTSNVLDIVRRHAVEACAAVAQVPVLRGEQPRIVRNIRELLSMDPAHWPSSTAEAIANVISEQDEEEDIDWQARARSAERHLSAERASHDRIMEGAKAASYERGFRDGEAAERGKR